MIELKGLEDWARGILATSISTLNRHYGTYKRSDEFSMSIKALPFFTRYRSAFCTLSESTLRESHQRLRGQKCEDNFWDAVLEVLQHPLPDDIAFDLIERDISTPQLAHSAQSDAVYWRLVAGHTDAILTLAQRAYTDSSRTLEEFQHIIDESHYLHLSDWVSEFVSQWSASSLEKRWAFEAAIQNYPQRNSWMEDNPEINQKPFVHFDLNRLSYIEQIEALYGAYNLEKMLSIASNEETPDEILYELEELREFPNATEISAAARHTLQRREEAALDSLL